MSEPSTFEEFWPTYLEAHSAKETRTMHFVGTAAALGCVAMFAKSGRPGWLIGAALAGYGPAWASHALVEGNKPATLSHPVWSLMADVKMAQMALTNELDGELERLGIKKLAAATT